MTQTPRWPAGLAASALLAALVVAPPAQAASQTFDQPGSIHLDHRVVSIAAGPISGGDIPDGGVLGSGIDVQEPPTGATLTDLYVDVTLTHPRMDDLDLVLVSPTGQSVTLMSDALGDTAVSGEAFEFRLQPLNSSSPPDDGACSPCNFRFSDHDTTDGDADRIGVGGPDLPPADPAVLGGSGVTGIWGLAVVDDTEATAAVQRLDSWSLELSYALPAVGSPSSLPIAGVPSVVTDLDLVLHDVQASKLLFTQIVLESPDGRRAHVLSDVIPTKLEDLDLTLDDEAATEVPRNEVPGVPASGQASYRPRDFDDHDPFEWVGGFDTAGLSSELKTFDGTDANGTWKLYVEQEWGSLGSSVLIGGWSLRITTADPPAPTAPPAPPPPAGATLDTTAPSIVKTTPRHRATSVARGVSPRIVFSEPVAAATLTRRTVRLADRQGRAVGAKLRYRADRRRLVVDPRKELEPGATYVLRVRAGVRDLAGNPLAKPRRFRFTVRD